VPPCHPPSNSSSAGVCFLHPHSSLLRSWRESISPHAPETLAYHRRRISVHAAVDQVTFCLGKFFYLHNRCFGPPESYLCRIRAAARLALSKSAARSQMGVHRLFTIDLLLSIATFLTPKESQRSLRWLEMERLRNLPHRRAQVMPRLQQLLC